MRILVACKETAGDILILTGLFKPIKDKFPGCKLYVATEKQYWPILEGNPYIDGTIEYHPSMIEYRTWESFGPQRGLFDIVYHPSIITQHIPMWIHSGHGEYLGDCYAGICNVEYGEQWLGRDNSLIEDFKLQQSDYITVHSQSRQDPKDYAYLQDVLNKIDIKKVQVGGPEDKKMDDIEVDLRGATSPQQLASVLQYSQLHLGMDSFPMHVALAVNCPVVVPFGGTYPKQGVNPRKQHLVHAIEVKNRGMCVTSCHLIECLAKKQCWHDKCINNISTREILEPISKLLPDKVSIPSKPTLSAYMVIRDGEKYNFPYKQTIVQALKLADEVVILDGGSTDGTKDALREMQKDNDKLKIHEEEWDINKPGFIGEAKASAAKHCTSDYRLQLDADEFIVEPYPGAILDIIERNPQMDCIDLPVINFYDGKDKIRIEENCWKFRITKNKDNIIHGPHGAARHFDPETMSIVADRTKSDYCEIIYDDTLEIVQHRPPMESFRYIVKHNELKAEYITDKKYIECLQEMIKESPYVLHVSWLDLDRKKRNGEFWDETQQGKKGWHNTTEDISVRINNQEDYIISTDLFCDQLESLLNVRRSDNLQM